jgi:hypothetical protein
MIFKIVIVALAAAWWILRVEAKRNINKTRELNDDELKRDLIRKARTMFPEARNDIAALDLLYQPFYRELLASRRLKAAKSERYWARCLNAIHRAKEESIEHALAFEENIVNRPLIIQFKK